MANEPPPSYSDAVADKSGPCPPGYGTTTQQGAPTQGGYSPAQAGYPHLPPSYQTGGTSVIMTQPATTIIQTFAEAPVRTVCPHCRADIVTATSYDAGTFSWLICVILCLVGCNLGCCLFPFCMDGCQDVVHSCPNCQQQITRWARM